MQSDQCYSWGSVESVKFRRPQGVYSGSQISSRGTQEDISWLLEEKTHNAGEQICYRIKMWQTCTSFKHVFFSFNIKYIAFTGFLKNESKALNRRPASFLERNTALVGWCQTCFLYTENVNIIWRKRWHNHLYMAAVDFAKMPYYTDHVIRDKRVYICVFTTPQPSRFALRRELCSCDPPLLGREVWARQVEDVNVIFIPK